MRAIIQLLFGVAVMALGYHFVPDTKEFTGVMLMLFGSILVFDARIDSLIVAYNANNESLNKETHET